MTLQNLLRPAAVCLIVVLLGGAGRSSMAQSTEPRDERLWQRALAIHRRAIVIDTHNDVTTPMTNNYFDLGGTPPVPYRTNIARMKQGGLTGEFFSLYMRPWYVEHGGSVRRTLDMIDCCLSCGRATSARSDARDFGGRHSPRRKDSTRLRR